jgi:hypothetical protein
MNRVQTLRSSITGWAPVAGTRQPGEIYVNWADQALGVIDASKTAMDLIAVRYWSIQANYAAGAHVIYSGAMYKALVPITAGPFDPTQWGSIVVGGVEEAPLDGQQYARQSGDWSVVTGPGGAFLPITGGTLTGDLVIAEATGNSSLIINKFAAGHLAQLEGRTNTGLRWAITLGDQTLETGSNAGSNFSINAFADGPADITGQTPLIHTPLFIDRASGLIRVTNDPQDTYGVATKNYVDLHAWREAPTGGAIYGRQSASWVVIPGSSISYLPLAGGTLTGNLGIAPPAGNPTIALSKYSGTAGLDNVIYGATAGSVRWVIVPGDDTPEGPGNVGSNFEINPVANDGVTAGASAISIARSTGQVSVAHDPLPGIPLGVATKQYVDSTATTVVREAPTDGQIYGRKSAGWAVVPTGGGPSGSYLPLTGGTLTGDLTVAEATGNSTIIISKVGSTHLAQLEGRTGSNIRWDMTLGDQTPEAGGNAGSDFSLNAFADGAVDGSAPLSTPIFISRSTGYVQFPVGDPVSPTGAATKHYVDQQVATVSSGGFNNNLIDNGDMSISQRGTGTLVVTSGQPRFWVDRWAGVATATRFTMGQNYNGLPPPTGFANFLGARCTTSGTPGSTDYFAFQHGFEGTTLNGLNWGTASAQSLTLSFWACSDRTGTFSGAINNAASTRSFVFTFVLSVANTPARFTVTIPGDTTGTWINSGTGLAMWLFFNLGSGTSLYTGTTGSWVAGNFIGATGSNGIIGHLNSNFYVTGVKLEPGSTATAFAYDPPAVRLQRCQRYYQVLGQVICDGYGGQGFMTMSHTFVCQMRDIPSANVVGSVTYSNANSFQFFTRTTNTVTVGAVTTGTGESGASATVELTAEI